LAETSSEPLVKVAFIHSGSNSWVPIMDTLQAVSEGGFIPNHIREERLEEVRERAEKSFLKTSTFQGTKNEFVQEAVRTYEQKFAETSERNKDMINIMKSLDLLVVSNLKIGTEDNEAHLRELATQIGIKQVKCLYHNPTFGKAEPENIRDVFSTVFLSGDPNEGILKIGFARQPKLLFLTDKVIPGTFDSELDNGINTKKFIEFPEKFYNHLRNVRTIVAPAYVMAGLSRTSEWQFHDTKSISVVNCGPTFNPADEQGARRIPGYKADRLETLVFFAITRDGQLKQVKPSGKTTSSRFAIKPQIIDPIIYGSLTSWSEFLAGDERRKKTMMIKRKEKEKAHSERGRYLASLQELSIENPTIENSRNVFPHVSESHIEDILNSESPIEVAVPPLRIETDFHVVRYNPQTVLNEGTEKEKVLPPKLEWAGTGRYVDGKYIGVKEGDYRFMLEAIDFAGNNWREELRTFGNHSIVSITLKDEKGKLGTPGFPKENRIYFATTRLWKDIVGDARIPLSRLTEKDIDPETDESHIYTELNLEAERINVEIDISHYKELPPSLIKKLNVVPKPKEPVLPEVPTKPVAADVAPVSGDEKTVARDKPEKGKSKRPTASTKALPMRTDEDIDPTMAGTAEIKSEKDSCEVLFDKYKNAGKFVTDEENLATVISFGNLLQHISRENMPDEVIDKLMGPVFRGYLGIISRNAQVTPSRMVALQDKFLELAKVHPDMFKLLTDPLKKEVEHTRIVLKEHKAERSGLEEELRMAKTSKKWAGKKNEDLEKDIKEHKSNLEMLGTQKLKAEKRGFRDRRAARIGILLLFGAAGLITYGTVQHYMLKLQTERQATEISILQDKKTDSLAEIDRLQQKIEEMKGAVVGGEGEVSDAVRYLADYIAEVKVALNNTAEGSIDVPKLDYKGRIALVEKIHNIVVNFNGRVDDLSERLGTQITLYENYSTETKEKLEDLGKQLTEAKKAGVNLEASLRTAETQRDDYERQVEAYKKRVAELVEQTARLETEVKKIPGLEERLTAVQEERDNLEKSQDEALRRQNEAIAARKAAEARVQPLEKRVAELNKTLEETIAKYKALGTEVERLEKDSEAIAKDYETQMAALKKKAASALNFYMRMTRSRAIRLPESIGDMITPEMDRQYFQGDLAKLCGEFHGVRLYTIRETQDGKEKEIPYIEVRRNLEDGPSSELVEISSVMLNKMMHGVQRARTAIETSHLMQVKAAYRLFMYDYFTENRDAPIFTGTFGDILAYLKKTVQNDRIDVREIMINSLGYKGYNERDRVPIQRPKKMVFGKK